jgi:hypothetical protein
VKTEIFFGKSEKQLDALVKKQPDGQITSDEVGSACRIPGFDRRAYRRANQLTRAWTHLHAASVGTFETCQPNLEMSVHRGKPEVIDRLSKRRF